MSNVNFANLAADNSQEGNVGGFLKIVPILATAPTRNWPIPSDISNGEINVTIPFPVSGQLPVGQSSSFILPVYSLPPNVIDVNSETIGEGGFHGEKHSIELMIAGFSKEIQAELIKYTNAGVFFLVQTSDLKWGVVGTSYRPIYMKKSQKFGKKGGEQRGTTLKGDEEGYLWGILPLATSVVSNLNFSLTPIVPV